MNKNTDYKKLANRLILSSVLCLPLTGQEAGDDMEDDIYTLDPFEVAPEETSGYVATTTMAGTRINTQLEDVGSAISVVTSEFLQDTGATDNESLLTYTTGTEVGGTQGNFANTGNGPFLDESSNFLRPHQSTRVRGLAAADNTKNYFITDIPWDGYNVDRVDMQRGPNSILFGLGSPAGVINTTTIAAKLNENTGKFEVRFGSYGSLRFSVDYNQVIIQDELAVRVAGLKNDKRFNQTQAFEEDERLFGTITWEPKSLNTDSMTTKIKANYENGSIDRNRPRTLPPIDNISAWFYDEEEMAAAFGSEYAEYALNKMGTDPFLTQDDSNEPGTGESTSNSDNFQPWIGNFAQVYGGPLVMFDGNGASSPFRNIQSEISENGALGPDGSVDNSIESIPFARHTSVDNWSQVSKDFNTLGLSSFALADYGIYKNISLTDPTVFDFYHNLLDGDNKWENSDFDAFNASLAQTFLGDKVGYEAVYDTQSYDEEQMALLSGERQAIYVDTNYNLIDGNPNPNFGRAFVSNSAAYGNSRRTSDRETMRFTAFAKYDFNDLNDDSWFTRLLGVHNVTGLYVKDKLEASYTSFQRWATDDDYGNAIGFANIMDNARQINTVTYLGGSLLDRDSASGANLPIVGSLLSPTNGVVEFFDTTWNAPGVDPGAFWDSDGDPETTDGAADFQSENGANYVGWNTMPFTVLDANDPEDFARLITNHRLTKNEITSKALVWQGQFWDGALVGMYGYRKDRAKTWNASAPIVDGTALASQNTLEDVTPTVFEGDPRSWSIVAHVDEFIPALPVGFSVFYNESSNFQPAANRVDHLGHAISPPTGHTKDYGFMIHTKDDKYSMKVNWYETLVTNGSNDVITSNVWAIGGIENWALNWATIFTENDGPDWRVNYQQRTIDGVKETAEQVAQDEIDDTTSYFANQPSDEFWDAWNTDRSLETLKAGIQTATAPTGLSATEDTLSEGIEIELTAMPTPNWRISFNAAKQEARRFNVGGAVGEWIASRKEVFENTDAGDLRIWWGGATSTALSCYRKDILGLYELMKLQEGALVPEIRKWRANLVSNYTWTEGPLDGFNIGGSFRWQDKVAIGYEAMEVDGSITFDLDNPIMGPSEEYFDFWLGYEHKLTDKIDWRIQLNVRNVFGKEELIPISYNPSPINATAGYRIAPNREWSISNTFSF